jgi:hypothetical protein
MFLRKLGVIHDEGVESIDPVCYTPEEFHRKKNEIGIVSAALKKAVRII